MATFIAAFPIFLYVIPTTFRYSTAFFATVFGINENIDITVFDSILNSYSYHYLELLLNMHINYNQKEQLQFQIPLTTAISDREAMSAKRNTFE